MPKNLKLEDGKKNDVNHIQSSKAGHSVFSFWHRARAYVRLSALRLHFLWGDVKSTHVCLRFRKQCLRSEKTSVARVAHVLLMCSVTGYVQVNTLVSKHAELIGNAAIV